MKSRTVRLMRDVVDPIERVIEIGLNRIAAQRKYYEANRERIVANMRSWRQRQKKAAG